MIDNQNKKNKFKLNLLRNIIINKLIKCSRIIQWFFNFNLRLWKNKFLIIIIKSNILKRLKIWNWLDFLKM